MNANITSQSGLVALTIGISLEWCNVVLTFINVGSGTCVCPRTPEDYACNNDLEYEMCVEGRYLTTYSITFCAPTDEYYSCSQGPYHCVSVQQIILLGKLENLT